LFLGTNEHAQLLGGWFEGAKEWTATGNELTRPEARKGSGGFLRRAEGRASHRTWLTALVATVVAFRWPDGTRTKGGVLYVGL